jgi:hypothetical protein
MWVEALKERRNPSRERFEIRDTQGNVLLVLPSCDYWIASLVLFTAVAVALHVFQAGPPWPSR